MRLNNKGFAISGILYSMFILVITLMFLVLSILAGRRTTLNKVSQEASANVNQRTIYKVNCSNIDFGSSVLFSYTGNEEVVTLSKGYYLIQAWGGAGAKSNSGEGGAGAYASTIYYVSADNTKLYLNIGGGGDTIINKGFEKTYNGGGAGNSLSGSGGGATSIATRTGLLTSLVDYHDSIILVAAGGGGAGTGDGGAGGGFNLGLGGTGSGNGPGEGASASSGGSGGIDSDSKKSGITGLFGQGGDAGIGDTNAYYGGGGGGGYYGGGGAAASSINNGGGGGGVSYINEDAYAITSSILKNGGIFKSNTDYKKYIGVGIDGNSTMPDTHTSNNSSILTQEKKGNASSGYVRVTNLVCS